MMRYKVAALGLCVGILMGGCSDDGPETSDLSKDEFLEEADEICADFVADLRERSETGSDGDDISVRDELVYLSASYSQVIDDIRAIGFPEEEADQLDDLFGDLEDAVDHLASDAESLDPDAGPDSLADTAASVKELTDAVGALRAYGFDNCSTA